ncbi:AraC-like DNA-binding protein [Marmoricola sp. OAE513]|uniref:hypothetical protein n=1 Tax=Marmoricola sp. OAE513 TaxID=2817894 RepID=UPI001AE2486A
MPAAIDQRARARRRTSDFTEYGAAARFAAVSAHVDASLADRSLGARSIAEHFGWPAYEVRNLLVTYGGVAAFVRRRRLDAALDLLAGDRHGQITLDDAAEATGLGSRRTLERAVRGFYGLSVREAQLLRARP